MVTLDEQDKFAALIVPRGVIGGKALPLKSMWNKSWGALCSTLLCYVGDSWKS